MTTRSALLESMSHWKVEAGDWEIEWQKAKEDVECVQGEAGGKGNEERLITAAEELWRLKHISWARIRGISVHPPSASIRSQHITERPEDKSTAQM